MKIKLFTVHDVKAGIYQTPFAFQSTGQAVRAFEDTANDATTAFNKHPEDYTLFELGIYDDEFATVEMLKTPIPLGKALDFIETHKPNLAQVK